MAKPRILLIWEHPFLRDTVVALLEQAGLTLVADLDAHVSIDAIKAYAPTHVLVEMSRVQRQALIAPLLEQEEITIIRINLDDNRLQVIQRQDRAISHSSDLLDLLKNQSTSASA